MNQITSTFFQIIANKVFLAVFFSWLLASLTKMSILLATERHPGMSSFYRSGGMPSTHTASVVGLTLGVLLFEGVGALFVVTLAFAIVVIHDAMGVRYEAEKHAKFLNELIKRQKFDKTYFSEHIGHKLPEVIVGAFIGIIIPIIVLYLRH
jgi:uncharacterized protein